MRSFFLSMMLLVTICQAETAPVKLVDDADYLTKLEKLQKNPPASDASANEKSAYIQDVICAARDARQYDKAEAMQRVFMAHTEDAAWKHLSLSIYLGKQGKFKDAEAEAKRSIEMRPNYAIPNLVLASWEWHLGKQAEARSRVEGIPRPADGDKDLGYYLGCRACFFASAGDEAKIEESVQDRMKLDPEKGRVFFARDIIFDPYRNKDWFIKLVGKTLADETK